MEKTPSKKRLHEIDILRFVAAVSVMLFHYCYRGYSAGYTKLKVTDGSGILSYGFLGVNLFFVISGFVILMSSEGAGVAKFLRSRICRLYPAFWICCSATFLAIVFLPNGVLKASIGQFFANLTMVGNYLGQASIDGVYWTLFIEIKFYAMVFLCILFRGMKHINLLLSVWLAATIGSRFLPDHLYKYSNTVLIADYSAYFIFGCAMYLLYRGGPRLLPVIIAIFAAADGIYLVIHESELVGSQNNISLNSWVSSAILLAIYLIFVAIATGKIPQISSKVSILGLLTYPLYLLHQNIGYLIFDRLISWWSPAVILVVTSAVMIGAAVLISKFVEPPISKMLRRVVG